MPEVSRYLYGREPFFRDDFPFAIRQVRNRTEDFNLDKRFRRMFWKITYVISGQGNYVIGDRKFPFRRNSLIVVHPGADTTYEIEGDALELYNLVFDRSFLPKEFLQLEDPFHFLRIFSAEYHQEYESPLYLLTATREIVTLIRSIYREYENNEPNRKTMLQLQFSELLLLVLRRTETKGHRNPEWTAFYVREYLKEHFREDISLQALAKELRISPERLSRLYRERTGKSMMEEVKKLRLEYAADLLTRSTITATAAAEKSGFRDPSYFYRSFAARFGCSPEKYRKKQA